MDFPDSYCTHMFRKTASTLPQVPPFYQDLSLPLPYERKIAASSGESVRRIKVYVHALYALKYVCSFGKNAFIFFAIDTLWSLF